MNTHQAFRSIDLRTWKRAAGMAAKAGIIAALLLTASAPAQSPPSIALRSAATFGVLAGVSVTSTGATVIEGDLGVSPGSSISGSPIVSGSIHAGDGIAAQAQLDATTAYDDAASRSVTASLSGNIGGQTLLRGVYKSGSSMELSSGDLTLDAQGDSSAVFIFLMASTLTTSTTCQLLLVNGAKASNVFWQVGTSAVLGSTALFSGTILAATSITMTTGALLDGRALARGGSVTMDANTILPVELVSLRASLETRGVRLLWRTATEKNNYGFEIERSVETMGAPSATQAWERIGFQAGNGTSSIPCSYEFLDAGILSMRDVLAASYRLRQIDRDGTQTFSPVVVVQLAPLSASPVLHVPHPNPCNTGATVSIFLAEKGNVTLTVHSIQGAEILRLCNGDYLEAGTHSYSCDLSAMPSDIFFVRLVQGETTRHQKLVVFR
ncbi:MAG: DUF3494 domain-containing protein [Ignavibacteria bacterium]|nr:DUF3494 domain-containing protein [Ignavibacteria bacterium]